VGTEVEHIGKDWIEVKGKPLKCLCIGDDKFLVVLSWEQVQYLEYSPLGKFYHLGRPLRMNKETAPISKQYSLDTKGLDKFKDLPCNKQVELMNLWAYKIGLMLDDLIPWHGVSNLERIELAIREYMILKEKEINAKD